MGANGLKRIALITDRAKACAIKLQDRFQMALGEWFLNVNEGVPYFQTVLVKNPDLGAIRQLFRKVILSIPPIASVEDLSFSYAVGRRTLGYTFNAITDSGQTISGGAGLPFVVL